MNKYKSLYKALKINTNKKNIISFIGAGGKTSTIYALADELININKRVVIITTTHMYRPEENWINSDDIDEIDQFIKKRKLAIIGKCVEDNKITYISDEFVDELINITDIILVEADGARGMSLKFHGFNEPKIQKRSNMIISLIGIDAVGKTIKQSCHRVEVATKVLGTSLYEEISENHIVNLIIKNRDEIIGVFPNKNIRYRVIINKVEKESELSSALRISDALKKNKISSIITSIKNKDYYSIKKWSDIDVSFN